MTLFFCLRHFDELNHQSAVSCVGDRSYIIGFMDKYTKLIQRNLFLARVDAFLLSLLFFIPIWYVFETQFASPATLGWIYAIGHLFTVFLELPTGVLADLLGRKWTIFFGLLINALSWMLISQVKNVGWLWSGYIINAVGVALVSGADVALTFDSLKELGKEKGYAKFSSKNSLIFRIGMVMATFSGGFLFGVNQRLPYFLVGVCNLIVGLLTLFKTEPRIDTEKFSFVSYIKQTKRGFKELTKNTFIKDFSVYYVLVGGVTWYCIYYLNQVFATDIGFSVIQRSWIFSGIFLIGAGVQLFLTHSKFLTRKFVYLMFPILVVVGLTPGYWLGKNSSIIFLFLIQFTGMMRFSVLNQYANLEFESKYRATAISALNMLVSLVFSALSILGGKIINFYGPGLVMTLLGILSLVFLTPITKALISKNER